jgi:hypothetical protein
VGAGAAYDGAEDDEGKAAAAAEAGDEVGGEREEALGPEREAAGGRAGARAGREAVEGARHGRGRAVEVVVLGCVRAERKVVGEERWSDVPGRGTPGCTALMRKNGGCALRS